MSPTPQFVGLASILLMLVLMFMKVHVAFALIIPGAVGLYALVGTTAMENVLTNTPLFAVSSWSLSVLPMFILMGMLLSSSGITAKVYESARLWTGWFPGGLAVGTNVAGAGLAAVSGSTIGNVYAIGRIGIPEMLKSGYDRRLAVGSVMAAGLPGQVIPPSTFLIVVAGITGAAVGPQLIAGILPGIGMVILFCVTIVVIGLIRPSWVGKKPGVGQSATERQLSSATWGKRIQSLSAVIPLLLLFAGIFGAMFSGILTATEAGAAGAAIALLLTLFYKRGDKPFGYVLKGLKEAGVSVGSIFLMIIGAHVLMQLVAVTRIGTMFSDLMVSLGLDRISFLFVVMIMYLILGMFMDPLAILLLTIPILMPTLETLGVDLLWFGVFAVLTGELAIITPPVGVLSFIVHGLAQNNDVNLGQEISLKDVFAGIGLFIPAILGLVALMIFFPDAVTWLAYMSAG